MTWRASTPDDHDCIATLMLALYAEDPAPIAPSRAGGLATLAELERHPIRGLAVVHAPDGGADVDAYALLCSFWSNELGGEVCIIDELFVAPSARGRGIATTLVTGLLRREVPWFERAVNVELEVTPGNARARALYERLGFRAYKNALMRARREPAIA
ncbi:MAG TPA: GNAT family N-acetyltransferase [Polyangiaceae bacterium]|nr:GNAT family N-acetyltransferase [Polyangiaceae bacterium]